MNHRIQEGFIQSHGDLHSFAFIEQVEFDHRQFESRNDIRNLRFIVRDFERDVAFHCVLGNLRDSFGSFVDRHHLLKHGNQGVVEFSLGNIACCTRF